MFFKKAMNYLSVETVAALSLLSKCVFAQQEPAQASKANNHTQELIMAGLLIIALVAAGINHLCSRNRYYPNLENRDQNNRYSVVRTV